MGKMTNEHLRGIFKSNFDLTNFAIALAHYHIKKTPGINLSEVLKEVQEHPEESYLQSLRDHDEAAQSAEEEGSV